MTTVVGLCNQWRLTSTQRMVPEGVEVVRNVHVLVIYYVDIRRMIVHSRLSMLLVLSIKNQADNFYGFVLPKMSSNL